MLLTANFSADFPNAAATWLHGISPKLNLSKLAVTFCADGGKLITAKYIQICHWCLGFFKFPNDSLFVLIISTSSTSHPIFLLVYILTCQSNCLLIKKLTTAVEVLKRKHSFARSSRHKFLPQFDAIVNYFVTCFLLELHKCFEF